MLIMQLLRDNLTVGFYWHHFLHLTFPSHSLLVMANMVKVSILTLQSFETVVERRMLNQLRCIMDYKEHPLHHTLDRPSLTDCYSSAVKATDTGNPSYLMPLDCLIRL